MRCSRCKAENPFGKKFCADCGARLQNCCPRCGAVNLEGKRFCGDCGGALPFVEASVHPPLPAKAPLDERVPDGRKDALDPAEGERRHSTVLFCDLVGSTELAARFDPEDWRDIAAQYQRTAAAAVTRLGGHVAEYLGDGLVVYFGWPEAHDNDAERAVRAGLAIVNSMTMLNARLSQERRIRLSIRVGIDAGSVVVGRSGGDAVRIFGQTPNIAARVQTLAEPDSVLITAAVHKLVSGLFVVEDRGAQQLKGIEHPLKLYRAIKPSAAGRRAPRSKLPQPTPFVGRKDEMRLLLSRWERAREGQGQLVLVVGEPGIGKSRLMEEFRSSITGSPHVWVECMCQQLFQSTPFHAVTQLLAQGLGWRDDENPQERVVRLESGLELAGLKLGEAVPLIAEMVGLPVPERYPALLLPPEQRRRRLLASLTTWVLSTARVKPLVLAIEDLHWIDPSTLELARILVEQSATAPLMLLSAARPEFRVPWPQRAHHVRITLNRLNDHHTRELVAGVMARTALTQDLADAIVKRTDGVPLFAEELTRLIVEGDSRSAVRDIPATLHDSLTARLDRLGPAKRVAQFAAVIGRQFSYELLRAVMAMPEEELQSALEKLTDAELVYARGMSPEATYQFKHALVQDAAYEALLKSHRRELHRQVALVMTERFPAIADAQPQILAHHWTQAAESELAISAWRKAGDTAFLRYACEETEASYRHALALLRTLPESHERDGRELELLNRFVPVLQLTRGWAAPEAVEAIAHARALAEKTDSLAQLLLQTVGSFVGVFSKGDVAASSELATQVFDLAQGDGSPPVLGLARVIKLSSCYLQGDLRGAEQHYLAGENLFLSAGERFPSTVGSGFGFGSHIAWLLGRSDTAHQRIRRAIAGATELRSPFELAYVWHLAAMLQLFLREFTHAKTAAAKSIALADEHGFQQYAAGSRVFLGLAEAAMGHPHDSMPLINLGLSGLTESGAEIMMTLYLCWVALAKSLQGKLTEALATVERALQANPAELAWRPEVIRIRGKLRLRLQQTDAAAADFREAIALAQKIGATAWELRAALSLARMLSRRGDVVAARDLLFPLYSIFAEGFDTKDLRDARALLA